MYICTGRYDKVEDTRQYTTVFFFYLDWAALDSKTTRPLNKGGGIANCAIHTLTHKTKRDFLGEKFSYRRPYGMDQWKQMFSQCVHISFISSHSSHMIASKSSSSALAGYWMSKFLSVFGCTTPKDPTFFHSSASPLFIMISAARPLKNMGSLPSAMV